jgi:hypothetical protein
MLLRDGDRQVIGRRVTAIMHERLDNDTSCCRDPLTAFADSIDCRLDTHP